MTHAVPTPGPWIQNSLSKIDRALAIRAQLDEDGHRYLFSSPNAIEWRWLDDPSLPYLIATVRINRLLPDEMMMLSGDLINNLRSALDLMVWQLTTLVTGQQARRSIAFPIGRTMGEVEARLTRMVSDGLPAVAADFIREKAPTEASGSTLWKLSELDNTHKHRRLLTVLAGGLQFAESQAGPIGVGLGMGDYREIHDGTEFHLGRGINWRPAVQIAFGSTWDANLLLMYDTVEACQHNVTTIVKEFGDIRP